MKPYVWKPLDDETKQRIEKAEVFFENVDKNNPELADIGRLGRALIDGLDFKQYEKDGAYWERNMLALYFAMYSNKAWKEFNEYLHEVGSDNAKDPENVPCGWYYDTDNNWEGWLRVISLLDGRITFHIPDDFDVGNLPQIEPRWDGHSTEEKWWRMTTACGCKAEPLKINGWIVRRGAADTHEVLGSTKNFIVFHPIHDGQHWKGFNTFAEVRAFATKEQFDKWHEELK
jgi:hypothetical protein